MKLRKALLCFAFSVAYAVSLAAPSKAESVVEVQGVLQVGEFFGPPSYGEQPGSDHIERSFFLQLPAPLGTQFKNGAGVPSANQNSLPSYFVQLVVPASEQRAANTLVGKRVRVIGTLFEAISGHHRTPMLVQVQKLSQVSKWQW